MRLLAGFSRLMAQMMQTHTRGAFLALIDIAAQIAPKPKFWGVNRHFPYKCAKY